MTTSAEPDPVMMTAVCHTPDCPVYNQPFVAPFYPNTEPPTYRAVCGQCGQPITDITPA